MTPRILIHVVLVWLAFLVADIANQHLENLIASPGLGEYEEHLFSVFRLWGFVIILIYIFVSLLDIRQFRRSDLLFIGIFWIVLNFFFMVFYRHYMKRYPWGMLFEDYDIREGRLKAFILLTELTGPYLLGVWRHFITRRRRRHASRGSSRGSSNRQAGKYEDTELPAA